MRRRRIDPVTAWVRSLTDNDYLLAREVADQLGISVNRLHRLGRKHPETLGPGYVGFMGALKVYLYDQSDVAAIREWMDYNATFVDSRWLQRQGHPPVWTADEHADRHRRQSLARYYLLTSQRCDQQGRTERAERARARHRELRAGLDAELAERVEALGRAGR